MRQEALETLSMRKTFLINSEQITNLFASWPVPNIFQKRNQARRSLVRKKDFIKCFTPPEGAQSFPPMHCPSTNISRNKQPRNWTNESYLHTEMKTGARRERKKDGNDESFPVAGPIPLGPVRLALTASPPHFYWQLAMNLKLRQWGTFSSLPGVR